MQAEASGLSPNSISYEQAALALCNEGHYRAARELVHSMGFNGMALTAKCEGVLQRCMEHLVEPRDPGAPFAMSRSVFDGKLETKKVQVLR